MNDANREPRYFHALQQAAFLKLGQAASLKGLLKPFKGKGDLEAWASQCFAMRDDLHAIELQRITLNMQISLLHTLGRQAQECASKAAEAEDAYLRRMAAINRRRPPERGTSA